MGAPELAAPRKIIHVNELPVLGSGKTDYVAIQRMAEIEGGTDDVRPARRGRG